MEQRPRCPWARSSRGPPTISTDRQEGLLPRLYHVAHVYTDVRLPLTGLAWLSMLKPSPGFSVCSRLHDPHACDQFLYPHLLSLPAIYSQSSTARRHRQLFESLGLSEREVAFLHLYYEVSRQGTVSSSICRPTDISAAQADVG